MHHETPPTPTRPSPDAGSLEVAYTVGLKGDDLALALLEQSEDCIKLLSADGHLDFMNCGGQRAMEIDNVQDFIGLLWWSLWPEKSQAFIEREFRAAMSGTCVDFEADCPTAKGTPRRWHVNLKPLLASDGQVVSVLATSRDATREPS